MKKIEINTELLALTVKSKRDHETKVSYKTTPFDLPLLELPEVRDVDPLIADKVVSPYAAHCRQAI
ncbi:hypothetical protein O9993_15425 [Vibrio lentus]|nr:hypothetical protein [Vibrio lentus]